jgi:predicted TPR repeat methyltransferase
VDDEHLARVYAAQDPEALAAAYAGWAGGYDRETLSLGYCLPFAVAAWMARHVEPGAGPVLDVGCGTGLSGPLLAALGYRRLEGMDFSDEMLRLASARGAYDALTRATLGERLPWPDAHFAAAFSAGVFTEGHAPAEAFREIARIVRPGGRVIATVRTSVLEPGGFRAVFAEMAHEGRWQVLEESAPFRAFASAEPDVLVQAFVFAVT